MSGKNRLKPVSIAILMIFLSLVLPTGCSNTSPEANKWTGLLSVIPANESTQQATFLRDDILKAEMIKKYSPAEPVKTLFDNYYFPASSTSTNEQYYNDADWLKELGFTQDDVYRVILAGNIAPPFSYYQAAEGQFDKAAIDEAVKTGTFREKLEIVSFHGQEYYSTGPDNAIDLTIRNSVFPLGMSYKLAVMPDALLWSNKTGQMQEMIDASKNRVNSLADDKNYQALAETLDNLNTFYAFFSSASYSLNHIKELYQNYKAENPMNDINNRYEQLLEALEKAILLKPFAALTSGIGLDENGYYLVIALANADEAAAKQNADLLEQRLNQVNENQPSQSLWSTFMNGKREISYQGNITTAKLYGEAWKLWRFSSSFQTPMWGFVDDAFIVTE